MQPTFRQIVLSIISSVICLSGHAGCDQSESGRQKPGTIAPNIFLIILDAASAPHFGCYGCRAATSPNVDRLASESILFDNAYSQTATTVTSTSSLLTGVRATTHLMNRKTKLPDRFPTIAEMLSKQGIKTYGFIGNPFAGAKSTGLARGYDKCVQVYALEALHGKRATEKTSHFRVTLPEDINGEVFKVLPDFDRRGTFAYIHFLQPHKPYDPPQKFREGFKCGKMTWDDLHVLFEAANHQGRTTKSTIRHIKGRYRANIKYVDEAVGELLDRLRQAGLYDESLIILAADHGDAFFKHRRFGHSTTLYDDMTRIPLLMKFPKSEKIKPQRFHNLVETIDILPTLFDYLGLKIPKQFEGDSLWPLIAGRQKTLDHPEVVNCTSQRNKHAIRVGNYKYIFTHSGREELYNLRSDPEEKHNIFSSEREKARALRQKLESIVDISSGRTLKTKSNLRSDPRMDELLRSLGYTGDE